MCLDISNVVFFVLVLVSKYFIGPSMFGDNGLVSINTRSYLSVMMAFILMAWRDLSIQTNIDIFLTVHTVRSGGALTHLCLVIYHNLCLATQDTISGGHILPAVKNTVFRLSHTMYQI